VASWLFSRKWGFGSRTVNILAISRVLSYMVEVQR
jgi:hypothetical protein